MVSGTQILVTGGAGFVGRNLVRRMFDDQADATVWIIDDLSTGLAPEMWPELDLKPARGQVAGEYRAPGGGTVRFLRHDAQAVFLSELGRIPAVLPERLPQFDRVVHLAAVVGGRLNLDNDPLSVGIDLGIDSSFFLWAAKVNRPGRILYASSSAAYPVAPQTGPQEPGLAESAIDFDRGILQPDFAYGWSKLTGEFLARLAVSKYGLTVGVVRPFSGYGEHQEPVYPVPAIAMRAAARMNPLPVWGSGQQARDFVHIDDCVEAMLRVLERIGDARALNIGSGVATTMREVATLLARIEGYEAEVVGTPGRPIGTVWRYCDPTMMQEVLDFKPSISLSEGLTRVLAVAHERLDRGVPIPA